MPSRRDRSLRQSSRGGPGLTIAVLGSAAGVSHVPRFMSHFTSAVACQCLLTGGRRRVHSGPFVRDRIVRLAPASKSSVLAAFGLLALLCAGQRILSITRLSGIRTNVSDVATRRLPAVITITNVRAVAAEVRIRRLRRLSLADVSNNRSGTVRQGERGIGQDVRDLRTADLLARGTHAVRGVRLRVGPLRRPRP